MPIRMRITPSSGHSCAASAALRLRGCEGGVAGPPEDVEERVALRVDLVAAVRRERLADDPPMRRADVGPAVAKLLHERRRSLDVREHEGDGAGEPLGHLSSKRLWQGKVNRRIGRLRCCVAVRGR